MKKTILLFFAIIFNVAAFANDSTYTLSAKNFLQLVKQFHPVAKQAALQVDKARAVLLASKGGFDPLLNMNGNSKTFDGINYYQHQSASITIPTWYGIEFQTGVEYLNGGRTNPQETTGKTNFTGISIPLAKNLLTDKRRAALQTAKIMVELSEQEKAILLNNLLKEASDAYWAWVQAYVNYQTYHNIIQVNEKRLRLVVLAYQNGDRPAIDTIEAITQLQNFEYLKNEALLQWQNSTVALNAFLWTTNDLPFELPAAVLPEKKRQEELYDGVDFEELENILQDAANRHPELVQYGYKSKALIIDKKLKFQELLPKIDLKYTQLGKGYDLLSFPAKNLLSNNQKLGLSIVLPIRLSSGRAEYKMAKIKIEENKLQLNQKAIQVTAKIKNTYNQLINYKNQAALLQKAFKNHTVLQKGEEIRFLNGESSLFLVNARENKTLETQLKLTEAVINYNKTNYSLLWSAGTLWLQ